MTLSLAIIGATFAMVIALGLLARRGHDMTLEQWSVGGRGFGSIFVFLLMAGEIYTTFTIGVSMARGTKRARRSRRGARHPWHATRAAERRQPWALLCRALR